MKHPPATFAAYPAFLADLKGRIAAARVSAARAVNRDLILLYWDLGQAIVKQQQTEGWGEAVIDRLSTDLRAAFPETRGFSPRNLRDMKRFYLTYRDAPVWRQAVARLTASALPSGSRPNRRQVVAKSPTADPLAPKPALAFASQAPQADDATPSLRQLVAEIPWGQNLLILNALTAPDARLYYLLATARFGWSRDVLRNQIKAQAYERARLEPKVHNFAAALPAPLAEQADEILKSRYHLEFLGIGQAVRERDLEDRLVTHLQAFILELGYGFCFVGRQYRLALGRKEYFVDLLFYHRFLKALVAFDLKIGTFEPEHAGKMDFYLNLLNAQERAPDDHPSIGVILCAEKNDIEVEFALKTKANPIGVAEYQLRSSLPRDLRGKLPSARQLAQAVRGLLPAPSGSS